MYEIRATAGFDAAHYLLNYEGACARMHGHTWTVEAAVTGSELDESELLMDFHDLRKLLREVIESFDHNCLNDLDAFSELSPTSENIAAYIYRELLVKLREFPHRATLAWVSVAESRDTKAVYREEG
ncbi:MAG: 6-carboxytetrahydropterin synthase QueD [Candidatus Solincola sediminis]|uniref:6-carboxy-5,6,7,8-tetrahydropterin synthase n=1 Tax=Candidatus Solincola sediminis TaxID=1797199 RepID=A0A1F2WFV3_9ACTN|nr:MAG: 6-carboxytetrahydropterin synthase QueD [Candidatus Solincola sediminis]